VLDAELGRVVSFLKTKGNYILWAAVVAALIAAIVMYVGRRYRDTRERLQAQYDQLMLSQGDPTVRPDDVLQGMKDLAAQYDDKRIGALASVHVGDLYAARATTAATEAERKSLQDQAAAYYARAAEAFPDQPMGIAKAHLGLAKLAEDRRDFKVAEAQYRAVLAMTDLAGYPVTAAAEQALKDLPALKEPVPMAATAPSTQPAETQPASRPAASAPPRATQPGATGKAGK